MYMWQGCVPCHELCKTCNGAGLSFCTTCKYYMRDDRCVAENYDALRYVTLLSLHSISSAAVCSEGTAVL